MNSDRFNDSQLVHVVIIGDLKGLLYKQRRARLSSDHPDHSSRNWLQRSETAARLVWSSEL